MHFVTRRVPLFTLKSFRCFVSSLRHFRSCAPRQRRVREARVYLSGFHSRPPGSPYMREVNSALIFAGYPGPSNVSRHGSSGASKGVTVLARNRVGRSPKLSGGLTLTPPLLSRFPPCPYVDCCDKRGGILRLFSPFFCLDLG